MSYQETALANIGVLKNKLSQTAYKERFEALLGEKAPGFISSLVSLASSTSLKKCDPDSVIAAAVIAATLDLPINQSLGFAWIVPYKNKAQFQIGWKGFVQLAIRTGQYQRINVVEVYEGQMRHYNPLTGDFSIDFDNKISENITHYAAFFRLKSGYEKTEIWTAEKVLEHGKRFSATYDKSKKEWKKDKWGNDTSPWVTDRIAMCKKTVLKYLLSKYGIMSIEMQKATIADQGSISLKNNGDYDVEYVDRSNGIEEKTGATVEGLKERLSSVKKGEEPKPENPFFDDLEIISRNSPDKLTAANNALASNDEDEFLRILEEAKNNVHLQ
jgi:recombination protein RecT